MSVIQNNLLLADDGYNLQRSLRFRGSASAYLNRTPASASNRQTWTWSAWIKRGIVGQSTVTNVLVQAGTAGTNDTGWYFSNADKIEFYTRTSSSLNGYITTNAVFRDPSSWYHVVITYDATNATAADRMRIYVNGVLQSVTVSNTLPQNTNSFVNNNVSHLIGNSGANYFDGYLAEVNFIDGQALTPSSFGANNASTGVWQPKKYAGTYGTNGFYLPFTDNSTTTTLGNDFSGNGNNWTTNNISLTAGVTYDSMTDVPTLTSATSANYCVINPLQKGTNSTISNANLTFSATGAVLTQALGSIYIPSGKYYWEVNVTTNTAGNAVFGTATASTNLNTGCGRDAFGWGYQPDTGTSYLWNNNSFTTAAADTRTGTFAVAFDADAGRLWFRNSSGNWISGDPATGTSPSFSSVPSNSAPSISFTSGGAASVEENANFGQRPFTYTPPTGFVALNTFNLPTPAIGATSSTQANKYFDVMLYTGNGDTSQTRQINGLSFQPDFSWIKCRSAAEDHVEQDVIRGAGNILRPNLTAAELTGRTDIMNGFTSSGFIVGSVGTTNTNGATYASWNWKANGTGVTNTAGTITSTVSANTSAGFSVVTYTGNNNNGTGTVGHGLGVSPKVVIVKRRDSTGNWMFGHASMSTANLRLNTTNAQITSFVTLNPNDFDSVKFNATSYGSGGVAADNINNLSATYVAYCFSEVAGYSKFGSYAGNGSNDGAFIYTGFKPKYVLFKAITGTNSGVYGWCVYDSSRNQFNVATRQLFPNLADAEYVGTTEGIDMLSNGFKFRNLIAGGNDANHTFIYMAFAENPFKYSLAR